MTAYLGNTFKVGAVTQTIPYAGNWAVVFNPADIPINNPTYECYRIVIKGGPPGSSFDVMVNNSLYDSVFPGDTNSWDPNNSMKLANGDTIGFYWNTGSSTAPTVWLYFQEATPL